MSHANHDNPNSTLVETFLIAFFFPVAAYCLLLLHRNLQEYAGLQSAAEEAIRAMYRGDEDKFVNIISQVPKEDRIAVLKLIDSQDPNFSVWHKKFAHKKNLVALAGHSLGPGFIPALIRIKAEFANQQNHLHDAHFTTFTTHRKGWKEKTGNYFLCDKDPVALKSAAKLLAVKETEIAFLGKGLSDNLAMLLSQSYTIADMIDGKMIVTLATEFIADNNTVRCLLEKLAKDYRAIKEIEQQQTENKELKKKINISMSQHQGHIIPDGKLYKESQIIDYVKANAEKIKILLLSQVAHNTGQKLDIYAIFNELEEIILKNDIIVILDLAHSLGNGNAINFSNDINNSKILLGKLPVRKIAAVFCNYKHCTGPAGSPSMIYVSEALSETFSSPGGWASLDPKKVFNDTAENNPKLLQKMTRPGVQQLSLSNPPPWSITPAQEFIKFMAKQPLDKIEHRSSAITTYLHQRLYEMFQSDLNMISPLNRNKRGAMLVFNIKGVDMARVSTQLYTNTASGEKSLCHELFLQGEDPQKRYEVDVRDNKIRITAHWGYTSFAEIDSFANKLKKVVDKLQQNNKTLSN